MTPEPARRPVTGHIIHAPVPEARTKDGTLISLPASHPFVSADAGFATWFARVPRQYGIEDVTNPQLWKRIERQLAERSKSTPRRGDLIRVVADSGSFDALFLITEVGSGYCLKYYAGLLPEEHG